MNAFKSALVLCFCAVLLTPLSSSLAQQADVYLQVQANEAELEDIIADLAQSLDNTQYRLRVEKGSTEAECNIIRASGYTEIDEIACETAKTCYSLDQSQGSEFSACLEKERQIAIEQLAQEKLQKRTEARRRVEEVKSMPEEMQIIEGFGPICSWSLFDAVIEISEKCMTDEFVQERNAMQQTLGLLDKWLSQDPRWGQGIFSKSNLKLEMLERPEAELCKPEGADVRFTKEILSLDQSKMREAVENYIEKHGKPEIKPCAPPSGD